jgi:ribonuclease P protein component
MLPKKERLSREEFNRFFSLGKRVHSPAFQVVYVSHEKLHASVVVPKKVAKSAVKRNVIRRRIYDIVRRYRDEAGIRGVYIFLVKPPAVGMPYETLKQEVHSIIKKIT